MNLQNRGTRYEPYPGQVCSSCGKEMQASNIREIYSGVSSDSLMVKCACHHCGSENEVLMRPSGSN
jgi:hypothetical protein